MTAQTEADLSDKSFITAYALHAEDSITWRMAENQIRYHLLKGGVILCFVSQSRFEMGGDSSFLAIGIGNAVKPSFKKPAMHLRGIPNIVASPYFFRSSFSDIS